MFTSCRNALVMAVRLGLICLVIAPLCAAAMPHRTSLRVLSDAEMVARMGDAPGTGKCKKSFGCEVGIVEDGKCVKCEIIASRFRCCDDDMGTSCDYTGATAPCDGGFRYSGPSTAGSCTCTSTAFTKGGTCNGTNDADCTTKCK
jgi:hypothetical protein